MILKLIENWKKKQTPNTRYVTTSTTTFSINQEKRRKLRKYENMKKIKTDLKMDLMILPHELFHENHKGIKPW